MEVYEVVFDHQKDDGYWVCSKKELVSISVKHGCSEKNNHDQAAEIIKKKYQRCKINKVTYL